MDPLRFESNNYPTLGVEIELGLVDRETGALVSGVGRIIERLPAEAARFIKPELMQCCVEINSEVRTDVGGIRNDLSGKLRLLEEAADPLGIGLWWGATHPFSRFHSQQITPDRRYLELLELLQEMARQLVTFGLHIHVGVDSGDKAVMICDQISEYLPIMLALSASSPFWDGHDTGLHSYRSKIMEGLPTAGLPTGLRNWSEYVWLVNHLIETEFIHSVRELWWDVRPHHRFGTVEIRVCDMPGSLDGVLGLTALVQSLVKHLSDRIDHGMYAQGVHPMFVRQNKWRACRYGNRARLVNPSTFKQQTIDEILEQLIPTLRPQAESLGCWEVLLELPQYARGMGWAEQQRRILSESGDPGEIVRRRTTESRISPPIPPEPSLQASLGEWL